MFRLFTALAEDYCRSTLGLRLQKERSITHSARPIIDALRTAADLMEAELSACSDHSGGETKRLFEANTAGVCEKEVGEKHEAIATRRNEVNECRVSCRPSPT